LSGAGDKPTPESEKISKFLVDIFGYAPRASYIDGFCLSCWKRMFEPRYVQETRKLFTRSKNGKMVSVTTKLFNKVAASTACPFCDKKFLKDRHLENREDKDDFMNDVKNQNHNKRKVEDD
jgi:hypothetical protein